MNISDLDLDALRRAVVWGAAFQKREPQLKIFPEVMPVEGTAEWIALARQLAEIAQSHALGLRPWQCAPIDVDDDAVAHPGVYGCRPDEIALRRTMRELNISVCEPDPASAIANAEAGADARPRRKARRR